MPQIFADSRRLQTVRKPIQLNAPPHPSEGNLVDPAPIAASSICENLVNLRLNLLHPFGLLAVVFLSHGLLAGTASAAEKPNVIFVIADQWREQALGCTGDPNVKTPNLDRFAGESVQFVNAVSGTPVCTPARASLLTGQRPLTNGLFTNDKPLNPEAVTMGKVFAAAGYDTACIGKWHVDGHGRTNFIPRERRQGFEYWKVLECTHDYNRSPYYADGPEKLMWEGYDAIAQTRDAESFVTAHAKSAKPFLLWLAWGPPHNPYHMAPQKFRAMYDPKNIQLRQNVPLTVAASAQKDLANYYANCTALDDCFGSLWKTLKDAGIEENTIIVFTSDHGDMLYSHDMQKKQKPFDESVCVPMFFHWPRELARSSRKADGPINSEDVMPTLLGLCGIAIPKTVEGLDFSGNLRGGKDPSDGAALIRCPVPFSEWSRAKGGREYRGIRSARYTYVRDLNGPWLLFDNQADPYQEHNLIGLPEQAALQAQLDAQLKQKLADARDEFLPADAYINKWNYRHEE